MRRFGALFFACHFNGTFNLPATGWGTLNSVPYGNSEFGTFNIGSLPKITGGFRWCNAQDFWGAFGLGTFGGSYGQGTWHGDWHGTDFDAARSSATYWRTDDEVHATGLMVYFLIKYI